ncbi:hypothetical protein AGMMS49982_09250 [Bacteroidia bacterium]|nr:hypothetical protein AGMMS49982_09250 [Bacteroidia bacterium]
MKASTLVLVLLMSVETDVYAKAKPDSIFSVLSHEMDNRDKYIRQKEQKIDQVKQMLVVPFLTDNQRATVYEQLFHEYQSFQVDSAVHYLELTMEIAKRHCNTECVYKLQMNLSYSYWIRGRFVDSIHELETLDRGQLDHLPEWLQAKYYETYMRIYRYYAEGDENHYYYARGNQYRDSLLSMLDENSQNYIILSAEKLKDTNQTEEAKQLIIKLLAELPPESPDCAHIEKVLADIYRKENNSAMQMRHYARSAIYDIRNAVNENTAMMALAFLFYEQGDIDKAHTCIQYSLDDAISCNARFRTFEISKVFPVIDSALHKKRRVYYAGLKRYLILVSLLSLLLIAVMIYAYWQMKRIVRIRRELSRTNVKLNELNTDLQTSNQNLAEANCIKEVYLGKFVDLCSGYIDKLDNYRHRLNKIANSGKMDELHKALKSTRFVTDALHDFHTNFDETFLRIFPAFIANFNALLPETEQQIPKRGELLNTELRIYALIRLGIQDSNKIAIFLRYSRTTVYTYRSKLKNKSLHPTDFEELVMRIGA